MSIDNVLKTVTGVSKYQASGGLYDERGAGNYIAVRFVNNAEAAKVLAGINEVEVEVTTTLNGVFKVTSETDKLVVETYDENETLLESLEFDLSDLYLETFVSVEFEDPFISLDDTTPYAVNFEVINRPENTHLTATSSNTDAFTVDVTNIENGSVDVTGIADGNGILTVSVLDSGDNIIASGIIPVSVSIAQQDYDLVWNVQQTIDGPRYSPYYFVWQSYNRKGITARYSMVDSDLNTLPSADYTASGVIVDENEQEIYSYICSSASANDKNLSADDSYAIGDLLSVKTQEEIEACKCIITVTIDGTDYVFQHNLGYYDI